MIFVNERCECLQTFRDKLFSRSSNRLFRQTINKKKYRKQPVLPGLRQSLVPRHKRSIGHHSERSADEFTWERINLHEEENFLLYLVPMIQRFENKWSNVLRQAPIYPKRHLFKRRESHQGEKNAQRNKPGINRLEAACREWRDNFCPCAIAYLVSKFSKFCNLGRTYLTPLPLGKYLWFFACKLLYAQRVFKRD